MIESLEQRLVLSAALTAVQTVQVSDGKDILYDDGSVTFTPDASHPGSTVSAYTGTQNVVQMIAAGGGIVTRFSQGGTYFSPDGRNIGGGGPTVHAYDGTHNIVAMVGVASGGVDTELGDGSVYFSPDGLNLGGGGNTVRAYTGTQTVVQMVGAGGGVDTYFDGGTVYFSPDGLNLGGLGNTVSAFTPRVGQLILEKLIPVSGGVDVLFTGHVPADNGLVNFSPDGLNLGGGGATIVAAAGDIGIRNILPVAEGVDTWGGADDDIYFSPDGLNLFGGSPVLTTRVYQFVTAGVGVEVDSDGGIYFSRTGTNLQGGGNSVLVSNGITDSIYLASAGGGVNVFLSNPITSVIEGAYFSPDGLNLNGSGSTVSVCDVAPTIDVIDDFDDVPVSVAGGIDVKFVELTGGGSVLFSPDGRNLGGGGDTVSATVGGPLLLIQANYPPGTGVLGYFYTFVGSPDANIYVSLTGRNLDGGGSTVRRG